MATTASLVSALKLPGLSSPSGNGRTRLGKPAAAAASRSRVCLSGTSDDRWTSPLTREMALVATFSSGVAAGLLLMSQPAFADLNKYECK